MLLVYREAPPHTAKGRLEVLVVQNPRIIVLAVVCVIAVACGRPDFGAPTSAEEDVVETDVGRATPGSPHDGVDFPVEAGADAGASANNGSPEYGADAGTVGPEPSGDHRPRSDFAFAVYRQLAAQGRNAVFAPHGLARSLVIAHAAVDQQTAAEVAAVVTPYLGYELYESFNAIDLALESREEAGGFQLLGAIWAQDGVSVSDGFVDVLARYLGLRIRLLDFATAPEEARNAINNWHSTETDGRLTEVLGPRAIDPSARFVITDASWFSAGWGFGGFDPAFTVYETFHGTENDVVVPMMHVDATLLTVEGPDFDAVILPYENGFSLLAVVPDDIDTFEANLDPELLERLIGEAVPTEVALRFPRVEVSGRVSLSSVSEALGLGALSAASYPVFDDGTVLDDAYQRTLISFHEAGTDATGGLEDGDEPPSGIYQALDFDRPFLFAIRDSQTSRLLYFGRVAQP